MFTKNQKVVCVDAAFPVSIKQLYTALPKKDAVYVVREVRDGVNADALVMDYLRRFEPSITLVGLVNPCNNKGVEFGFSCKRFRGLEEMRASNVEKKEDLIAA